MPDLTASPTIDRDQAICIASRAFAAYMLFWVVDDLTLLPRQLLSAVHYVSDPTAAGMSLATAIGASYLLRSAIVDVIANILRVTLLLMAAGWFYRCGPRIIKFFTAGSE